MPLSRCGTEVAVAHALVPLSHGAAPRPAHWDTSSGLGWKPTVPFSWSIKVKLGLIHSRKTREAAGKAEMERAGVANALRFVRLSHTLHGGSDQLEAASTHFWHSQQLLAATIPPIASNR